MVNLMPPLLLQGTLQKKTPSKLVKLNGALKYIPCTLKLCFNGLPSVGNRHNSCSVLSNVLEDRLREIKVLQWRVAPTSCVVGEGIVWRAEIGGSDHNGAWQAPFRVTSALNLIARATAQPVVEQSRTQSSSVCSIALTVQVTIPTSPTCTISSNTKKTQPYFSSPANCL